MTQTTIIHRASATAQTEKASRYLQQMAKHFGHKLSVTYDEHAGHLPFPFGDCRMNAEDGTLLFRLEAQDSEGLERLMQVVESHFARFAFREELALDWLRG